MKSDIPLLASGGYPSSQNRNFAPVWDQGKMASVSVTSGACRGECVCSLVYLLHYVFT